MFCSFTSTTRVFFTGEYRRKLAVLGLAKGDPAPPELLKPIFRFIELDIGVPTFDSGLCLRAISDESQSDPSSIR